MLLMYADAMLKEEQMSCKYCRGNKKNKRLMSTDCDEINFDIYVGANSPILVA